MSNGNQVGRAAKYRTRRKEILRKKTQKSNGMHVEQLEPKMLLTGPQIVGISPNAGDLLQEGDLRNVAPQELTFRFDENQIIDAETLGGIIVSNTTTSEQIAPGYVGLGESANEVILRFAEALEDGTYRIDIQGGGPSALRNVNGEAFNDGANASVTFGLDLAPLVAAVVPQPITRSGGLSQARNQIEVHFNDDDLLPSSASQARFYQLLFTADTITNADDVVHLPTSVDYNPDTNIARLTFASDISDLSGEGTYRLRVGTDEVLPGAPTTILAINEIGGTFEAAANLGTLGRADTVVSSAIDTVAYPLNYPGGIAEPGRTDTLNIPADENDGITILEYNFQDRFFVETLDQTFLNLVSEEQKDVARQMLAILSSEVGVQFVETADAGITIATASVPLLVPDVVAVPLGFGNNEFGGNWSSEALRQLITLLDGEFAGFPDPTFAQEDPTRDFAFLRPIFVDPELPNPPVIDPLTAEQLYPRNSSLVNLQRAHRPDSNDADVFSFEVSSRGVLTAETIAQRNGSGLDSTVRLYRDNGVSPVLVAQNDDYFGADSFIDLEIEPGTYFVTVTSTGLQYNPIDGNGTGGTSQGEYDLRLSFQPNANNSLTDATGNALDGDADGKAGGVFNYWFQAADESNTIYVDKVATGVGQRGSISSPFNEIDQALQASQPGDVVRIVGNGGVDGNLGTLRNNSAYEIGFDSFGARLPDGSSMVLPQGVTVMIDAGAVFKFSNSGIQVGSSSVSIDLSGSAVQVLGTPENSVVFTSFNDESIGIDTNPLPTVPSPGDWGGILIRNDIDRSEGRFDYEQIGVFPNYINHADIRYGGGRVSIASVEQVIAPVHLVDARADISFNRITFSADAAISVNPNSFEETRFHAIDSLGINYQETPFTPDYSRFGPDIHDNLIVNNTTNGLFVRIDTVASRELERMTVVGRWDDLDIVHVVPENLIIEGDIGPAVIDADGNFTPILGAGLKIDPGAVVKLDGTRIEGALGANILAEGTEGRSIVFTSLLDDRFGAGGTYDTSSIDTVDAASGDWSGLFVSNIGSLSLDHTIIAFGGGLSRVEGSFSAFNAVEIHQADARITNSIIEFSASGRGGQADLDRPGRPDNAKGAIFVRGSSPIIVNNIIRGTEGIEVPAINVDISTLNDSLVSDYGRSTGQADVIAEFQDNQGALIRQNRLADNSLNGLEIRGGTVSRGTVLDDTDIVHIVFDSIDVPDFVSQGGVRLESSSEESLVVKLFGANAGFVASGSSTGSTDRIGGILDIVGQPGHPVVMTSLYDDTVGAGFDTDGNPLNVTSSFNRPLPTQPADSFQIDLNFGPIMRDLPSYREAAELAVRIWESILEDPVRITIDVEFEEMDAGVLGFAINEIAVVDFDNVVNELRADAIGRDHEFITTQLPNYEDFADNVILPDDPADPFTINRDMAISMANAKALGFNTEALPQTASLYDATETLDASISMNIDYELWDFDRSDGILPTQFDFTGVMLHEIGHTLGFVSVVDVVDSALGNPGAGTTDPNDPDAGPATPRDLSVNTLDLFRMSPGEGAEDFANAPRNLDPRQEHVFYDGGLFDPVTPRNFPPVSIPRITVGDVPLSRGQEFGDGNQASHLKDSQFIEGLSLGMMDPTAAPGRETRLTEVDRQAFDLIGWDVVGGAIPGDWRGVALETLAHDANIGITIERESSDSSEVGNAIPDLAEFIGSIAPDGKSGDENNRLGHTVQGFLNSNRDVDVYSFSGESGTQIWLDIDRTDPTLDTVVELIDANGRVLARSDNSYSEQIGESQLSVAAGIQARPLAVNPAGGEDFWSTNVKDAGFRVFLPGAPGSLGTYHVRVRSSSDSIDVLSGGQSSGVYELQLRLGELDELPGSTVRHADISYAVDGIRVRGLPGSSPLAGTAKEDGSLNDDLPIPTFAENNMLSPDPVRGADRFSIPVDEVTYNDLVRDPLRLFPELPVFARSNAPTESEFQGPQKVGNIQATQQGAINISGSLDIPDFEVILPPDLELLGVDIDWYEFKVSGPTTMTFDIDYASGISGPDTSIFVYEAFYRPAGTAEELTGARLIYSSKDGNDADDLPAPLSGADLDDLSRGSVSTDDPFLGPVSIVPTGSPDLDGGFRFLVAVTAGLLPSEFNQFTQAIPLPDPEREESTDRGVFENTTLPDNPFVRLEPADTITRVLVDDFELTDAEPTTNAVPHFLGDVPLFLSSQTGISLVNPFTGSNGGEVGPLSVPIGDFDIRAGLGNPETDDWNFYGYSLGDTDANSGNYLVINPDDASLRGVEDGAGGGGQGDNAFTDDGLVTNVQVPNPDDPAEPPTIEAVDVGVQFEAFEFFDSNIGYAIGHRPDIGVFNILYQFEVPRGNTVGTEQDEEILAAITPPGTLSGFTNFAERGVICVDPSDANCANSADTRGADTVLSVMFDAVSDDQMSIADGATVTVGEGDDATIVEFNTGPELVFNLDPASGRALADGDVFNVNGTRYEVETGQVLVVNDPALVADGDTITIANSSDLNRQQHTFEFDSGNGVADGNIAINVAGGTLAEAIVAAINSTTIGLQASSVGNRISVQGDAAGGITVSNSAAMGIEGGSGVTNGTPFYAEETFTNEAAVQAIVGVVSDAVAVGDRVILPGGSLVTSDWLERDVVIASSSDNSLANPDAIGIDIHPADTREVIAEKIADVLDGNVNGWQVLLRGSDIFTESTSSSALVIGGTNPGGRVMGMHFVDGVLYVVSDKGGLYTVPGFDGEAAGAPIRADYITTSTDLTGARFSGLTLGPPNIEGGRYASTLFASTARGEVYAFDTTGLPQEVFADGAHMVSTGVGGANGLLFSPADETLWHVTDRKGADIGHGTLDDFGLRTDAGLSFHFGDANPDLTENRNYNFPGGTHGSLMTDPFTLEGYSGADQPVLYFNYFLGTDATSAANPNIPVGGDSFRVFVTDENAPVGEGRGEWVMLGSNQVADLADEVVQLFDNTWEDQPELYPGEPQLPDEDTYILRRNGLRDPYTETRSVLTDEGVPQNVEFPLAVPSEEETIWRQARIDLSQFAGSSSLRLRFDFSSAGGLGFGNGGAIELRTVAGELLNDGDQFVIDDVTFEFNEGVSVNVPAGVLIPDGELVVLDGPSTLPATVLQYQKTEATGVSVYVSPNLVPTDRESFQLDVAGERTRFAFDNDGSATGSSITVDATTGSLVTAIASAINGAELPYTASVDGNLVVLSANVELLPAQTGLVQVTPVSVTETMNSLDVAAATADAINGVEDGTTASTLGRKVTLQNVTGADLSSGSFFATSGLSGANAATDVQLVPFDQSMSAEDVAGQVAAAITTAFANGHGDTVKTYQNTIFIYDHTVGSPGPLGLAAVLPGDTGHLYDPQRGLDNQLQYVLGSEENEQDVDDENPFDETDVNFVVPNAGVYVDDLIIGFASRGEKVVDHRVSSIDLVSFAAARVSDERYRVLSPQTQRLRGTDNDVERNDINGRPPTLPDEGAGGGADDENADTIYDGNEWTPLVDRSHFLPEQPGFVLDPNFTGSAVGPYQLAIRIASTPTIDKLAEGEFIDPRDRLAESTTLFARSGIELTDGETILLNNGSQALTLEYEDVLIGDGVQPGNVPIAFDVDDTNLVLAETIRNALNAQSVRSLFGVTASGADGAVEGPATSNAVQLHGTLVFVLPGSAIDFVETQATESSNTTAVQSQVIIDSNTISNSLMFGVVTEDGHRAVPNPALFDPEGLLVHSPIQTGDYASSLGAARNFAAENIQNQLPSVVVSNNVISRSGEGGVHASGDAGGFLIKPPLAGEAFQAEVWDDDFPFIFAITDYNGKTVQFEFTTDDQLQNVTPTVPVLITPTANCPHAFACMPRTDLVTNPNMSTELARAINGSGLDVVVYQNSAGVSVDPLFIEGAAAVVGVAAGDSLDRIRLADWFTPYYDQVDGVRTYSRIINNTIVGNGGTLTDNTQIEVDVFNPQPGDEFVKTVLVNDHTDAGVVIDDFAFPVVLNNITVNLEAGVRADASSMDAIVGGNLFQHNVINTDGINIGDFPIELGTNESLFVDIGNDNFYLSPSARAIDSSLDSLEDRPDLVSLKEPLGIARSNILTPERDALGQLREDDPNVETPSGLGQNVFKDRGAIDRVDFAGPTISLLNPRDNDQAGNDKNSAPNVVSLDSTVLTSFQLQFSDTDGIGEGTGIAPSTVTSESVVLTRDGRVLQDGLDYSFSFDSTNGVIRLTPIAGVWPNGSEYQLQLASSVADLAGNALVPNQTSGATTFTISSAAGSDYGDAPQPYPTLLADNGAVHVIESGFFLGGGVTEDENGQPNAGAASDGADDGVSIPGILSRDTPNDITVVASADGFLDAWIDLNQDGDWNDSGETIFSSFGLTAGANELTIDLPTEIPTGNTFARFRFSSTGGLAPTGVTSNGEVEDYLVTIDPGNIWTNSVNSLDVTGDGNVSSLDVLRIIQEITNNRTSDETTAELFIPAIDPNTPETVGFVDVNGDGFVTARDALIVIRAINEGTTPQAEPSGEPDDDVTEDNDLLLAVASSLDDTRDDVFGDLDWLDA